jgi:hypothetical protein
VQRLSLILILTPSIHSCSIYGTYQEAEAGDGGAGAGHGGADKGSSPSWPTNITNIIWIKLYSRLPAISRLACCGCLVTYSPTDGVEFSGDGISGRRASSSRLACFTMAALPVVSSLDVFLCVGVYKSIHVLVPRCTASEPI